MAHGAEIVTPPVVRIFFAFPFLLPTFAAPYVIEGYIDVIEFGEHLVIAQADEADDGDGANIDMMNAHWCDIHPDKCNNKDDEDEDQGGEEEEGC